ncbi:MAG TPA: RNA polymerase sigma factor [Planctomycetaceae bacterium]|nr:RNA polymerase sigma factor [Planctomycetaceae bacterium]
MADPETHHTNGATPSSDSSAFAHCRWLKTVLVARSGDPAAGDDLLQEVLLAAEKSRRNGESPKELRPWLYRVAVRQALLHRRKLGRQRRALNRLQVEKLAREQPVAPHEWIVSREREELVRQALARLPPKEAEILMLKYTENWNYQQIAEHQGVTHSAVEGRLHRARKRLRTFLIAMNLDETNP